MHDLNPINVPILFSGRRWRHSRWIAPPPPKKKERKKDKDRTHPAALELLFTLQICKWLADTSLIACLANSQNPENVFEQQMAFAGGAAC